MNYSAVLFDLDGTLLDTLEDIADAANAALARYSFPPHPVESYRYFVGEGVPHLIQQILPQHHRQEKTMAQVSQAYVAEYQKAWNVNTKPYPGIPELLDELTHRHLPMAILSNKPQPFTSQCVNEFLSKWRFEQVIGATAQVPRKPDPAAALNIAQAMELQPRKFLYLGDTKTDMQTAVAAGMHPVGVLWGFRPRAELEASGARNIIANPHDLLPLLAL